MRVIHISLTIRIREAKLLSNTVAYSGIDWYTASVNSSRQELLDSTTRLYIRAAQILDPLRLQVWEEKGITFPQLRILFRVRAQPGIDLQTLAAGLGMSASA